MVHPFHQHAEHKKGHTRVKHILSSGGASHPDAAADKKLFGKLIAAHDSGESKVEGRKGPARFARGGKVHKAKGQTNIAIVVPQKSNSPAPEPQAGPVPPGPTAGPAAMPPPMPPSGAGGPPGMPPPPMRASGGRVGGDSSKENLKGWSGRAKSKSYARGGRLPTGGAESGVGRLQKAKT